MKLEQTKNGSSQVQKLWKDCFHDTKEYMEFYFKWKTKDNTVFGIYDQEKLVSMVQLNPYELSVRGTKIHSYYIVGVATEVHHRKQGLMRQLLQESFEYMYQEEVPFAYLMPAKEAIYLPFDFRIVTIQKRKSIPLYELTHPVAEGVKAASISEKTEQLKSMLSFSYMDTSSSQELERLAKFANHRFAMSEDAYTIRDSYYYERMIAELKVCGGNLYALQVLGEYKGYIAYAIESERLEVLESVCEPEYESLLLNQLENELADTIEEVGETTPSTAPPIMARIIHMKSFLELLRSKIEVSFVLEVEDSLLPENSGRYQITCGSSRCDVAKISEREYNGVEVDLAGDIAYLTRFFFGRLTQKEERELYGKCRKEKRERFATISVLKQIHLNEIV